MRRQARFTVVSVLLFLARCPHEGPAFVIAGNSSQWLQIGEVADRFV